MTAVELVADPVRLSVARCLGEEPGSSAPEVAAATRLHLNTVRAHLRALEDAGAVERDADSGGAPGRPVVRYRLRRGFTPPGDELLGLSGLLARTVADLDTGAASLHALGFEWGRAWGEHAKDAPVEERVRGALERLGFDVRFEGHRLEMSGCPCPLVSTSSPELVCGLADAVIDGVLDGTTRRVRRHRHRPRARRCDATLSAA